MNVAKTALKLQQIKLRLREHDDRARKDIMFLLVLVEYLLGQISRGPE